MKTCIECGKPLNTGGNAKGTRCRICITARELRLPVRRKQAKARAELVSEVGTGIPGRILRRVWLIDRATDAPAQLAYVVRFSDGREKRVLPGDVLKQAKEAARDGPQRK